MSLERVIVDVANDSGVVKGAEGLHMMKHGLSVAEVQVGPTTLFSVPSSPTYHSNCPPSWRKVADSGFLLYCVFSGATLGWFASDILVYGVRILPCQQLL